MSSIAQIPVSTATAPSKLSAAGQIAAQFAPLLGQQYAASGQLGRPTLHGVDSGGKVMPLGFSFLSTTTRPFVAPARVGSDTYKLLSAFAGRPISPTDPIGYRSVTGTAADIRNVRPAFRLEDLDQIKLRTVGNSPSDSLSFQNFIFGDSLLSKVYSRVEDKLGIDAAAVKDVVSNAVSNFVSPLLQPGTKIFEPLRNLQHTLSEDRKKYSEPNAQIYERPDRDSKPKVKNRDPNTKSAKQKSSSPLKSFATAVLAMVKSFR